MSTKHMGASKGMHQHVLAYPVPLTGAAIKEAEAKYKQEVINHKGRRNSTPAPAAPWKNHRPVVFGEPGILRGPGQTSLPRLPSAPSLSPGTIDQQTIAVQQGSLGSSSLPPPTLDATVTGVQKIAMQQETSGGLAAPNVFHSDATSQKGVNTALQGSQDWVPRAPKAHSMVTRNQDLFIHPSLPKQVPTGPKNASGQQSVTVQQSSDSRQNSKSRQKLKQQQQQQNLAQSHKSNQKQSPKQPQNLKRKAQQNPKAQQSSNPNKKQKTSPKADNATKLKGMLAINYGTPQPEAPGEITEFAKAVHRYTDWLESDALVDASDARDEISRLFELSAASKRYAKLLVRRVDGDNINLQEARPILGYTQRVQKSWRSRAPFSG